MTFPPAPLRTDYADDTPAASTHAAAHDGVDTAVNATVTELVGHEAATTAVHGIADTTALVLTTDARLSNQRVPTDGSVTTAKLADGAVTLVKTTGILPTSGAGLGGAGVSSQQLIDWAAGSAFQMTALTYDANGVLASATGTWPDGSAGTFTATAVNVSFLAVDAYTLTHAASSKTVTQAAVTRNASGDITAQPALTVA